MSQLKREDRECGNCFLPFIILSKPENEIEATICPFCGSELHNDEEDDS